MNMFLNNVLNPPKELKVGQIWYNNQTKRDFLITDDRFLEKTGVLRSVHISRVIELNDGNEIIIKSDLYKFYPTDRISLRFTEGPISKNELDYYLGEIIEDDLHLIKESIKNTSDSYTEVQQIILGAILEEIEPVRLSAINYFANQSEEKSANIIFCISPHLEADIKPFEYKLAAADDSYLDSEQFYELERKNRDNSYVLIDDESTLIRLSLVNGNLYLVIFAKENKILIDNMEFTQAEIKFTSSDNSLEVLPNQMGYISFDMKNYSKEESKITFNINGRYFEGKIRLE